MAETSESICESADLHNSGVSMAVPDLDAWFAREVLPLEATLIQFLRRHWRNAADVEDLLQDIYVRLYESALKELPSQPRQFVFTTARNLLIDRVRHAQIIPIEAVSDLDALETAQDLPGPDRSAIARDELRRLQSALDRLPPKSREAVVLARIEGLSGREIAARMGLSEATVSYHLTNGINMLADILYSEAPVLRSRA
ncbi:MAG TPA: RNA polymerase sigma factor [Rhizomicrobium sp.]|nr:RNA polymerase sigma factor [Rhizomicrobium sp.]